MLAGVQASSGLQLAGERGVLGHRSHVDGRPGRPVCRSDYEPIAVAEAHGATSTTIGHPLRWEELLQRQQGYQAIYRVWASSSMASMGYGPIEEDRGASYINQPPAYTTTVTMAYSKLHSTNGIIE